MVSALAIPMAWSLMLRNRFRVFQVLNAIYPLLALFAVVLAASRGGFLPALVALTVVPLTLARLGLVGRVLLFVAVVGSATAAFVYVPQMFPELERNLERLSETDEQLFGGTLTGRTDIWSGGVQVFLTSPIVGVGMGGFYRASAAVLDAPRSPHNAFLSVAVGSGLVGLALFVSLFAIVTIGVLRRRERRTEHLVLLAALLVGMMPTNSDNDKFVCFILATLATVRPFVLTFSGSPESVPTPAPAAVSAPVPTPAPSTVHLHRLRPEET
ncbi:hypothetical protein BH23DEI1_BH23DEI1_24470 [soil metagenome]